MVGVKQADIAGRTERRPFEQAWIDGRPRYAEIGTAGENVLADLIGRRLSRVTR